MKPAAPCLPSPRRHLPASSHGSAGSLTENEKVGSPDKFLYCMIRLIGLGVVLMFASHCPLAMRSAKQMSDGEPGPPVLYTGGQHAA